MPLSAALNLKLSLGNMKIKRGLLFMNQVRHFLQQFLGTGVFRMDPKMKGSKAVPCIKPLMPVY